MTAEFGIVPAPPAEGAQQLPAQLKTYKDMTVDQPLPDKNNPQVVFLGVLLPSGKGAVFALTGESILHGNARCLPSATQCQAIELLPGQSERSRFAFAAGADRVRVRLIYRRFWPEVAAGKGWPDDSIVVVSQEWPVAGE